MNRPIIAGEDRLNADALKARHGAQGCLAVLRALGVDTDTGSPSGGNLGGLRLPPALGNDTNPSVSVDLTRWLINDHGGHFTGTLYQLVQAALGVDFPEAVRFAAEACGERPGAVPAALPTASKLTASKSDPDALAAFKRAPWKHGREAARYDYLDADGEPVLQVRRYEPTDPALEGEKTFRQYRPDADSRDGWAPGLKGMSAEAKATPYRLPDVLAAASRGEGLFIVEGEKDADALAALGFAATCNAMGAGEWKPEHARHLAASSRPAFVCILPDADAPGVEHALTVAETFAALGLQVRIAEPFGPPGSKRDASDVLADGLKPEALREHAEAATLYLGEPPAWAAGFLAPAPDADAGTNHRLGSEAEIEPEAEAYIADGPRIPAAVYEALPDELRAACRLLREGHERDVFLTGLLPCLTAAMPNVLTRYSRRWKALPIMAAVVAPAGSGKGTLQLAADTVALIDERLRTASQTRLDEWQTLDKKERDGEECPPVVTLRLPADNSLRGITDALVAGGGRGLVFETEIRVLASSLKQDWGDFKGLLLKAAEQEPYERGRKGEPPTYLRRPELAAAMSGTPRSFTDWMEDAEDGLFSRFLFYAFTSPPVWVNQFEDENDAALDAALARIGRCLDGLHRALSNRTLTDADGEPAPLFLILTRDQREHVNRTFAALQHAVHGTGRAELLASVKRGAFQAVRIAGALALYRLAATTQGGCAALSSLKSYAPTDAEVRAAVVLVRCYLEHAARLAVSFASDPAAKLESEERRRFFEALPDAFETAEALAIGEQVGMSARAVERSLKALTDRHGLVSRLRRGQYRKAPPAKLPPLPSPSADMSEASGVSEASGKGISERPLPTLPTLPTEPTLPPQPAQGDGSSLPPDPPTVSPTAPARYPRGTRVLTPGGPGEVLQHFADRITVALDGHKRTTDFDPHDVMLPDEPEPTAPF